MGGVQIILHYTISEQTKKIAAEFVYTYIFIEQNRNRDQS